VTATTTGTRPPVPRTPRPRRTARQLRPAVRWSLKVASILVILAAWQFYGRNEPIILSTPSAIFSAAVDMIKDGSLPHALLTTLAELGVGFVTGSVAGIIFGLAAGRSQVIAALLDWPFNALYAIPIVALTPLIVVWFGFGLTARAVVVFLFVFFALFINTMRGGQEVDTDLIEVATSFCSTERRIWVDLILPSALPYVVSGLRQAIGRALIGVIVAEFYTALSGLGELITTNASDFATARMWVPIVTIALLGVVATALLEWAERRLARWRVTI
jgi:NitT/TauT family transport system permease protein